MTGFIDQRLYDAFDGKLPLEELTDDELQELESLIFKAIANKLQAVAPPPILQ